MLKKVIAEFTSRTALSHKKVVEILQEKGVILHMPETIEIGADVNINNIAPGVELHGNTRIFGKRTMIGTGSIIGAEAPATLNNCIVGKNVNLSGGSFLDTVFFNNINVGPFCQFRTGTIIEDNVDIGMSVGLKHTIILKNSALGSLINFCDLTFCGGPSKEQHSEVGGSVGHANFTIHHDKATASIFGSVPNSLLFIDEPVFLGGKTTYIGPIRIDGGYIIPAGNIVHKDITQDNLNIELNLPLGKALKLHELNPAKVEDKFKKNLYYIGSLAALKYWYYKVRHSLTNERSEQLVLLAGIENINLILNERIKQLDVFINTLPADNNEFIKVFWSKNKEEISSFSDFILNNQDFNPPEILSRNLKTTPNNYEEIIKSFSPEIQQATLEWLNKLIKYWEKVFEQSKQLSLFLLSEYDQLLPTTYSTHP